MDHAYDPQNVFARILRGEIPNRTVWETEHTLAFRDIAPKAPDHVLVIPKGPYVTYDHFCAEASEAEIVDFTRTVAKVVSLIGAEALAAAYDVVADGSDNFDTRYLASDACFLAERPLISGALGTFDASLTTIRAHERNENGEFNPTYRCLFPEPPPPGTVPACAEAGVMGALAGMLGSMMALEAIREIVGFGEGLVGRLLMLDARTMRFETLRYKRDPANPLNGDGPVIADLSAHRK